MKKRLLVLSSLLLFSVLAYQMLFRVEADPVNPKHGLATFYDYSTTDLGSYNSTFLISEASLQKWEEAFNHYFEQTQTSYAQRMRFYTYLYLAQKDAAFLSYNARQCFLGSLDPLTESLVKALLPNFSDFPTLEKDAYSERLGEMVFQKYAARLNQEAHNPHRWPSTCWEGASKEGEEVENWIAFAAPLPLPSSPPSLDNKKVWAQELKQLQNARRHLSKEQIRLAHAWAGKDAEKKEWRLLANHYMEENNVPLGKLLFVRAILMMGLYDAAIATHEAKYTFCVPRPALVDPSIQTLFGDPLSPSYPSGHSVMGGAAAFILSTFFPDETSHWKNLAKESGESRIWAGVHYPIDIEEGEKLGTKVGENIINAYGHI